MNRKKSFALFATLVITLTAFSACGNNPALQTPGTQPATGSYSEPSPEPDTAGDAVSRNGRDVIIVATENEPDSVTAAEHNTTASSYINNLTYNGLFRQGHDLNPVPDLLESYEFISDTEILMSIHKGVKFHDGSELTTEDVKASLMYAKEFLQVEQFTQNIVDVEIIDDYNFKLITTGPSSTLYYDLAHHGNYIVPKALIDSGHDFNSNPIGTGPYKMTKWTLGDSLEFDVNEEYFDEEHSSTIPKLIWRIIPEGSSRTIALETGEADFIIEVATIDVERLDSNPDLIVLQKTGITHNFIMINNELPGFSNQKVRQALNAAIDRETVVQVATNGIATPVISQAPIGFNGSTDENAVGYNPELAKQLMAESGVDPSTIEFNILCSNEAKRRAAEVIQANLAEIGVSVSIESMDLATYLSRSIDGNYSAAIGGFTGTGEMVTYLKSVYWSKQIGGSNRSRVENPEVDALIEKAMITVDPDERKALEEQCISLLNKLAPQIPLYQDKIIRAYDKNLEGMVVTGTGSMYFEKLRWAE